ncbi:MAG: helix-turn-helix domain-containing protein [Planctomycetaceae bacterium]
MNRDLSISQVARHLQIRRETVKRLIEQGHLEAYDAAPPSAPRRAYRITEPALTAFKQARRFRKHVPQNRKVSPAEVIEFF